MFFFVESFAVCVRVCSQSVLFTKCLLNSLKYLLPGEGDGCMGGSGIEPPPPSWCPNQPRVLDAAPVDFLGGKTRITKMNNLGAMVWFEGPAVQG